MAVWLRETIARLNKENTEREFSAGCKAEPKTYVGIHTLSTNGRVTVQSSVSLRGRAVSVYKVADMIDDVKRGMPVNKDIKIPQTVRDRKPERSFSMSG